MSQHLDKTYSTLNKVFSVMIGATLLTFGAGWLYQNRTAVGDPRGKIGDMYKEWLSSATKARDYPEFKSSIKTADGKDFDEVMKTGWKNNGLTDQFNKGNPFQPNPPAFRPTPPAAPPRFGR